MQSQLSSRPFNASKLRVHAVMWAITEQQSIWITGETTEADKQINSSRSTRSQGEIHVLVILHHKIFAVSEKQWQEANLIISTPATVPPSSANSIKFDIYSTCCSLQLAKANPRSSVKQSQPSSRSKRVFHYQPPKLDCKNHTSDSLNDFRQQHLELPLDEGRRISATDATPGRTGPRMAQRSPQIHNSRISPCSPSLSRSERRR